MRSIVVNRPSAWLLGAAAILALIAIPPASAGSGKLPTSGIPGNVIAIGDAADTRLDQLSNAIAASLARIKNLNSPTAADLTREVNAGKRAVDTAVRLAARRLDADIDHRVSLLWLKPSIKWQSILQVDFLRDGLINELHALAADAKTDLRSYANARKSARRLASNLPGIYDVTIDGRPSSPVLARLSLEPDFTVQGVVYTDRFRALAGSAASADLRASFDKIEIIRGMHWFVTKGKITIVSPHARASAAVGPRSRSFALTGIDLLPELADTIPRNTIDDRSIRMVKDGLDIATTQMQLTTLRFTRQ